MTDRFSRKRVLGALGAFALPLGAAPATQAAEAYTLRCSIATPMGSTFEIAATRIAVSVFHRSGGRLKIEVYPNDQLVKQADTFNGLTSGVVDLAIQSSVVLQNVLPQIQVFDMPFMFKNLDAGFRVLDGAVGRDLASDLAAKGVLVLAWGTGGFKELQTTTKVVTVPDDMKGLRIRILPVPVYAAMYQALGAIPVSIEFSEAYMALQQHTIDAIDSALDAAAAQKFYAVCKHCAMLNHIFSVVPLLASKSKVESLPPALQNILREESRTGLAFWRATFIKHTAEVIDLMKQNGVAFTEVQYAAFRRAMDPVYATYRTKLGGDLLDRVSRAAGS